MILAGYPELLKSLKSGSFIRDVKKLQEMGFKGLDSGFGAENEYRLWWGDLQEAQIEEIKETFHPFKEVSLHAGFIGLDLLSPHPGIRQLTMEEYLTHLELAEKVGAKTVTFHAGEGLNLEQEELDTLMKTAMKTFDDKARKSGVFACWETGTGYFFPFEKYDLIRELSLTNTGICMDTGHTMGMWKKFDAGNSKIKTFPQFITRYKDLIWMIHIHDYQGNPKGKHVWNDHHAVGDGEIDWREFFSSLVNTGYDGILSMEYHPDAYGDEEDLLEKCEYIKRLARDCGADII